MPCVIVQTPEHAARPERERGILRERVEHAGAAGLQSGLEQRQADHREHRRPEQHHGDARDHDRQVDDDDARIGREHLREGLAGLPAPRAEPIAQEEIGVERDEHGDPDQHRAVGPDARRHRGRQARDIEGRDRIKSAAEQAEDEEAVDEAEHAVVHHEERRQEQARQSARAPGRDAAHQDLGDVERADDQVLDPIEQHQGERAPAERRHADHGQQVDGEDLDQGAHRLQGALTVWTGTAVAELCFVAI